jgi:hypothetical protein
MPSMRDDTRASRMEPGVPIGMCGEWIGCKKFRRCGLGSIAEPLQRRIHSSGRHPQELRHYVKGLIGSHEEGTP